MAIRVNENSYENCVKSMIFLPSLKSKRIMIAGSGQQISVKSFISKIMPRVNDDKANNMLINSAVFTNEKRNCDCCTIY